MDVADSARSTPPGTPGESGIRAPSYRFVEGMHLRQWLARATAPLAIACTNGAGLLDWDVLPRHDAPLAWAALPAETETVVRIVGASLIVLAAWLRIESKGVLVRRVTLTTGGAYAWVRHPFYLAVLVGSVGLFLLSGALGAVVAAVWLALAAPVYAATVAGEEDGLGTLFPGDWSSYSGRVPRLLPFRGRCAPTTGAELRVTWRNLVREHEPPRLLRYFGATAAVGGSVAGGPAGLTLLGVAAVLFVASRIAPGIRPPSRRAAT
jgi:protein-S-isoprenylcysteine O-methyltransferase Ste14